MSTHGRRQGSVLPGAMGSNIQHEIWCSLPCTRPMTKGTAGCTETRAPSSLWGSCIGT